MYNIVRKNDRNGLIIMAGMQSYAYDSATQIATYLRYINETGKPLTNVIYNFHPYQGGGQGNEKAVTAVVRELLGSKEIGPVIMTEFGQYCCGSNLQKCPNNPNLLCNSHNTGDNFSFNIINMAAQYDISWTAWAWWGVSGYECDSIRKCNDLRNENGSYVSNGTYGGAPWQLIWSNYINTDTINVLSTQTDSNTINVSPNVMEIKGYLPRPCIMGNYNIGNHCGFSYNTSILSLPYTDFNGQSAYSVILPGLPSINNDCTKQGCPTINCGFTYACKT